jgi:Predicted Zn peptidase
LRGELPKLSQWEKLSRPKLTFVELERLALKTKVPLGYFFLPEPPSYEVPIPDFRTISGDHPEELSIDLAEVVYAMQRRQQWYMSYQMERGFAPLKFVGSASLSTPIASVAKSIKEALALTPNWASKFRTYDDAVSQLRACVESAGVLISIDGVVANNNNRTLSVDEFRGFALADPYAPLVFINGRDWKSAQVFTMFHELAHIWIEQSGISDLSMDSLVNKVERFCNSVAAEALVPEDDLKSIWYDYRDDATFTQLAKNYKVNPIVVARRLHELDLINTKTLSNFFSNYEGGDPGKKNDSTGGDFYNNQIFKVGRRFMRVVARAANDGAINYIDAYRLTGLTNKTFDKYLERIGGING